MYACTRGNHTSQSLRAGGDQAARRNSAATRISTSAMGLWRPAAGEVLLPLLGVRNGEVDGTGTGTVLVLFGPYAVLDATAMLAKAETEAESASVLVLYCGMEV